MEKLILPFKKGVTRAVQAPVKTGVFIGRYLHAILCGGDKIARERIAVELKKLVLGKGAEGVLKGILHLPGKGREFFSIHGSDPPAPESKAGAAAQYR